MRSFGLTLMSVGSCLSPVGTFDRLRFEARVHIIPVSGCGTAERPLLPAVKLKWDITAASD